MELLTPNCIPQLKKNNIFFLVVVIACFIYVLLVRMYRTETSFVVFRPPNHAFVISDSQSPKPKQPKAEIGEYTLIPYMSIIEKRFSYKTDGRCDNTCPKTNPACKAKSMNDWRNLASKKQLHGVPLFSPTEYMFPWELQYVKDSPLQDEKTLPSLTKSKIIFESQNGSTPPEDDQNIVLLENVQAKFRVILLDQYGHFRNKGGDEVRAWLTGNKNNTNVAVTADVEDYHNGTYGVFVTVPWTGLAKLHVTVTYTREYIRATLNHHRLGAHRVVIANFIRGDIKEATICHGTPNVPGRPCVCNMTKWNGQAYYCGRPLDKRLSCDDRPRMSMTRFPSFRNLTDAEAMLEKHAGRNPAKAEIQHQLKINVAEGREYPTLPPCFKSSPQLTWKKTHRVGYWSGSDKKVWKSHICREREMTPTWIRKCLKSTTFWMLGDSQIRKMVEHFNNVLECNEAVKKWPYLCHCKNKKLNATFFFRPHQYPLYLSQTGLLFVNNGNETDFLANIPSQGDHVVVLHFYLHFAGSHLSALRLRLRIMKEAVAKLIERNPSVLIFIRGPHTSAVEWSFNHMFGGDVLGAFIRDMYIEIFADLQDKIYFLDAWGMSISIENLKLHPKAYFFKSQWRTILSYKCV